MANQTIVDIVTQVVTPAIQAPFELVDVEYEKMGGDYVLSILIDKPGGITVEDTAQLTDVVSPLLDTIQPDPFPEQYMLEVSSPGLERPLKTAEALSNAVCSYINVSLYKSIDKVKIFEGDLLSFDGETLTIDYMDKTRHNTLD
ncbi:ribosome maturation factor RimP, partial [Streptococcus agalactiae]|nr:ribosome maturation factor RimP [Streptococcus agalactiae]